VHILAAETARIHCGAGDPGFLRKPYLVDGQGRPGGGGLLLLEAVDYASAEVVIRQDPMVLSGGVDWHLSQWCPAVGDLAVRPHGAAQP
jgi:hypothetical protein